MKEHIVRTGQSLMDVAVICYGDVAGLVFILADNPALKGPTDRIYEGQVIKYRDEAIDPRKKIYLEDYATIATISKTEMPEGVGFWRLDEYQVQ
jgi:hypothetical protein